MGDMADLAIERGMAEDDYEYDYPDEFEDENCDCPPSSRFHYSAPKYKVCRCCGIGKLHWGLTLRGGWYLFDSKNEIHKCKAKPLSFLKKNNTKFPDWKNVRRHVYPEKVKSGEWFQIDPYMGAVSGQRNYIKNGAVKWDVCLSKTLRVGDVIPTGMVLEEELKNYD